jgi:hypothetical protein
MAAKKKRRVRRTERDRPRRQTVSGRSADREPYVVPERETPLSPELIELVRRDVQEVLGLEAGAVTETQLGLRQYLEHVAGKVEGVLGLEQGTATGAGLELLRGTEYLVTVLARPAPAAAPLAAALAVSFRELFVPEDFAFSVSRGEYLTVRGHHGSMGGPVGFGLRLPIPQDDRVDFAIRTNVQSIADFVSTQRRAQWPAAAAELQVRVEPDAVYVWWERTAEATPILVLQPFSRAELNL